MIIVLPEDEKLIIQLGRKLEEYVGRLERAEKVGAARARMSALCKVAVVRTLLREGRVDTEALRLSLGEYERSPFFPGCFENACGVVEDYCATRGANLVGGTGLPAL